MGRKKRKTFLELKIYFINIIIVPGTDLCFTVVTVSCSYAIPCCSVRKYIGSIPGESLSNASCRLTYPKDPWCKHHRWIRWRLRGQVHSLLRGYTLKTLDMWNHFQLSTHFSMDQSLPGKPLTGWNVSDYFKKCLYAWQYNFDFLPENLSHNKNVECGSI